MKYLNTRKLVRIWFTDNPNNYLPKTNQFRMAELREKNPEAEIMLVTNNSILSNIAQQELKTFCTHYKLINYNFDTLATKLTTPLEQELYQLAQKEILYAIDKKGGNLAAASDIARLFFIDQGFIYSDFDTKIALHSLPEWHALSPYSAPFLLLVYYDQVRNGYIFCNDIIARTNPSQNYTTLANIGNDMLERYKNTKNILPRISNIALFSSFLSAHRHLNDIFSIRNIIENHYTTDAFVSAHNAQNKDELIKRIRKNVQNNKEPVFWNRRFLMDLSISDDELLNRWFLYEKKMFLQGSIMHFSGPETWQDYVFKMTGRYSPDATIDSTIKKLACYSIAAHSLAAPLCSNQTMGESFLVNHFELTAYFDRGIQGPTNDESWDTTGVQHFHAQPVLEK